MNAVSNVAKEYLEKNLRIFINITFWAYEINTDFAVNIGN